MNKRHLYILCGILFLIGGGITAYRIFGLGFPALPDQTSETWRVEARVQFNAADAPARLEMMLPQNFGQFAILSQSFIAPRFGIVTSQPDVNRHAVFTLAKPVGREVVYYRAVIHKIRSSEPPPEDRNPVLQRSGFDDTEAAAARSIARQIEPQAADTASFVALLVEHLKNPTPQRAAATLLGPNPTTRKLVETAVRILAVAALPARAVHGIALQPDRRDGHFSHWLEFWDDGKWQPFDPTTASVKVPEGHLTWWRGDRPFITSTGTSGREVSVAVRRVYEFTLTNALQQAKSLNSRLIEFSLLGLPLGTQEVYRILLVVPLGILFLVVLRNVVGIKTFGTFMPVLIAMAFRETQLIAGLVMFTVVVATGLMVRFYLEQLKLLLVPRLASVVMVVIIIMAVLSVVSHKLGFERGLSVALFPIVILSMTIERMTIVWDERGAREALQQGLGSLSVAVVCYLVMNITAVQHFLFVFPESLLIVLALCLLLGRYSGYRLVELPRFRILAGGK